MQDVVTFDKSQHDYFAKLSDFHAQFRMVGNNYNQTLKELEEPLFRAQNRSIDVQVREVYDAVSADYA